MHALDLGNVLQILYFRGPLRPTCTTYVSIKSSVWGITFDQHGKQA